MAAAVTKGSKRIVLSSFANAAIPEGRRPLLSQDSEKLAAQTRAAEQSEHPVHTSNPNSESSLQQHNFNLPHANEPLTESASRVAIPRPTLTFQTPEPEKQVSHHDERSLARTSEPRRQPETTVPTAHNVGAERIVTETGGLFSEGDVVQVACIRSA